MRTIFNFRNSRKLGVLTLVTASILVLSSCSSFSGASYNDGIYVEEPAAKTYESQPEAQYTDGSAAYYEQIFQEGADQHGDNFESDAVFTDVDSYSSGSYDQQNPDETSYYGGGVAGWGENPSSVTINYINNGFGWGGGFNNFGWGPGWGWGGFNNFGWGGLGWNYGYGWNGGFYGNNFGYVGPWVLNNRFGWGGFYGGYGWNNWGWNGVYYGYNYNNNNYAYLNNRRDGRSTFGNTGLTGRATTNRSGEISNRNVGRGTYGESRGRSIDGNRSSSRNTNGIQTGRTSRSSNGTVSPSSRRSSTATPSSSRRSSTYSPSSSRSGRTSSPTMSPSSGRSSSPTVSPSSGRSSSGSSSGRSSGGGGRSSGGSSSGGRRG